MRQLHRAVTLQVHFPNCAAMEFATEDELCEYEKKRLENIQRNCELLKRLGTCHNPGFECISSSGALYRLAATGKRFKQTL